MLNDKLLDVAEGRIKRLMVSMPPRHGKSMLTSQYFPAWYLGRHPERRIILASYEADFARSWGRKARDVIDEWGEEVFGVTTRADSSAADRWDLAGHTGGMVTAGVGGPITGKGANIFLIDDPVKGPQEARSLTEQEKAWDWFKSVAYTRLEPDGAIILIMTRWNQNDLAGKLLEKAHHDGEAWETIRLPAIAEADDQLGRKPGEALWPERFPIDRLRQIRDTIEPYWWSCLYQQDPKPEGGTEWPRDFFEDVLFEPFETPDGFPSDLICRVLALDPSKGKSDKSGDYSAFVMLGVDQQWTLWVDADLDNTRPVESETGRSIIGDGLELYRKFNPQAVIIETNGFQELVARAFLRVSQGRQLSLPLYTKCNTEPKTTRIRALGPYLAQKRLRVKNTPGGRLLVQQLRDFPMAEFDDGPDALKLGEEMANALITGKRDNSPQLLRA